VAAQDQAINTNYFKNKIWKKEIDSKCRLCKQHETIDHLTSGCSILAKNEYLMSARGRPKKNWMEGHERKKPK